MISKYTKGMKCKYCGKEMTLDDIDFIFTGCGYEYLLCNCGATCIVRVRYDKIWKKEWVKKDE